MLTLLKESFLDTYFFGYTLKIVDALLITLKQIF